MTTVRIKLTQRNGAFNTRQAHLHGIKKLEIVAKSIMQLIQIDSPMITTAIFRDLLRRGAFSDTKNTMRSEWTIDRNTRVVTTGAIDALTNLISADAIAALAPEDVRHTPLKNINRALANQDMRLDVEIGGVAIPPIDHLAMAPQARIDVDWAGSMILRVSNWNVELFLIEGRNEEFDKIKVDMRQRPGKLNELMIAQAAFIRVIGGRGRINSSGLRILRHVGIEKLAHNDLPEALQLHFANEE